jgi:trk system potassium uptake protein TrkH
MTLSKKILKTILDQIYRGVFLSSLIGFFILIYDTGVNTSESTSTILGFFYMFLLLAEIILTGLRLSFKVTTFLFKVALFDILSLVFLVILLISYIFPSIFFGLFNDHNWLKLGVLLVFIREFSSRKIQLKRSTLNPAQLFIISFLSIIFIGSLLLMLPNATHNGISFLDALFTSTSAVCVTGLIVVDTATYFTEFGKIIIMCLIQIGGLGILTFASYFSYFFKGGSSYESQLMMSDMSNTKQIGEVFGTLKKIIIITFFIEFIGALFIYFQLSSVLIPSFYDRVFFSVFHSISAFCNAGFSTLTNGMYEIGYQFNYPLHLILIGLFVFGGLGFPIIVNVLGFLKYLVKNTLLSISNKQNLRYKPWVLNINSRITLITTLALTVVGTVLFFITEYNNSLAAHDGFGKFVTAFFGATTPRTAGFNTIDMTTMNVSTILITILLMFIGASPASTGGGIKTSTFAVATMNFISLAKGKTKIEVFRREIADISVKRAFATISLSLIVIGFGILGMTQFDPQIDVLSLAFECFSAFSTVGLSVGITFGLSAGSKVILIIIMFIGRVSMLTLLIAVIRKVKHVNYRYPSEDITIN